MAYTEAGRSAEYAMGAMGLMDLLFCRTGYRQSLPCALHLSHTGSCRLHRTYRGSADSSPAASLDAETHLSVFASHTLAMRIRI